MKYSIAASVCLLVAAAPLAAQQPLRPLSLSQARAIAAEHNPAYRRARNELRVAEAAERQGWGAFLPTLRLSVSSGANLSRSFTGVNDFGQPVRLDDPREYTGSSAMQSITLGDLTLFDGGARISELRAARASARASRAGVSAEARRLEAELARRYYRALRTERLIELEERLLEGAREQLEANQRLLRIAAATPVDVIGAEVDVARQEQAAETARGEVAKAMLALREEIGLAGDTAWTLSDTEPESFDPAALAVDSLVDLALGSDPRVQQLEAEMEAASQRLRAARAARLPNLSAYASASRSAYRSEYEALAELNPLDQSFGFGFSISLPIFSQFRTSYAIAQARAQREGAQEELRAARLAAEREVRTALLDLQNAARAVRLAERAAELSRDRVELAREQYRLGSISFTELQTIIDRAAQAERDALNARFDFADALVTLQEKAGGGDGNDEF